MNYHLLLIFFIIDPRLLLFMISIVKISFPLFLSLRMVSDFLDSLGFLSTVEDIVMLEHPTQEKIMQCTSCVMLGNLIIFFVFLVAHYGMNFSISFLAIGEKPRNFVFGLDNFSYFKIEIFSCALFGSYVYQSCT